MPGKHRIASVSRSCDYTRVHTLAVDRYFPLTGIGVRGFGRRRAYFDLIEPTVPATGDILLFLSGVAVTQGDE